MSLVGPRPPSHTIRPLGEYTPEMRKRFVSRVNWFSSDFWSSLDWDQKIVYDNRYVDLINEKGLVVDIQILLLTLWIVIKRGNTVKKIWLYRLKIIQ